MNSRKLLRRVVCSLAAVLSGPVFAATDLVQFESCPSVSIKVERGGRLSSLMVIDQEHQAWTTTSAVLEQSGYRLDWLLLDEEASVQLLLLYSEFIPLPHQGSISSAEFGELHIARPSGTVVGERPEFRSERRIERVALLSRPKADASGYEELAQAEVLALVDGCVIDVLVLLPGGTLQEAADLMAELRFFGRPVKNAPHTLTSVVVAAP